MKTATQLSLFLANKPGTLAAVCEALAQNGINVHALSVLEAVDHAVVRMVVSDSRKALHLLGERGVLVVEREVLLLKGRSRPGELADIAHRLSENDINIEYAYTATPPDVDTGMMVMSVGNMAKAKKILRNY